jgi:hypothetical protein
MDWERGVKRLAFVSAVVVGVLHCVLFIGYGGGWLYSFFKLIRLKPGSVPDDVLAVLLVFLIGFVPVWGIPSAFCWALRGFKDGRGGHVAAGKSEQNPTAQGTDVERLKWLPGGSSKKR